MSDTADSLIQQESRYLFQNYGRQPIVIARGEGTRVWDVDGKEYLDFVGGLAVNVLGHCHPAVVEAVAGQVGQLIHTSNLFYTRPMIELATLLVDNSCLDRAFFCNSGSEAVETAIKIARRWGKDDRDGAFEIISMNDAFHGRTAGALAATGTLRYREPFEPLPEGFTHVPWNDIGAVRRATTDRTVAVLVEPIQGEGGVNMPTPGYLKLIRGWCDERGLLLILDEIQVGIGRTGTLFAYEQEGIEPDIMCLAKGLAGGLPIGAVLASEHIAAHLVPGDHGTTFGANPVAAAAGVATLKFIEENGILAQAVRASERLKERLCSLEDRFGDVTEIRGRGLILALELEGDHAADLVSACREKGLLINNVRPNAVRFLPALNVSDDEIDRACEVLGESLARIAGDN
ncbi:MAG TPA: acetylornithine transaminase [Dehalococcoidia bacterium]|nr:acetylornithine transaminase [Dehalococcoidia bacterium]